MQTCLLNKLLRDKPRIHLTCSRKKIPFKNSNYFKNLIGCYIFEVTMNTSSCLSWETFSREKSQTDVTSHGDSTREKTSLLSEYCITLACHWYSFSVGYLELEDFLKVNLYDTNNLWETQMKNLILFSRIA